jgi:uncharacterized protein YqgC (DUF456 family)
LRPGPPGYGDGVDALGVFVVALVIAVGLVGVVVPLLPGTVLVALAVVVWARVESGTGAWLVAVAALLFLAAGQVLKYTVPGRRLRDSAVPSSTLIGGAVVGIVGFFVVPVVGLPLGFVAGVYAMEWRRQGHREAWPSTVVAIKAVGVSILIELVAGLVAAATWLLGAVLVG